MSIDGVEAGCLFKETKDNVRTSLRGRTYANVEQVAKSFGGGGHMLASGCTFDVSVDEAEQMILPLLIKATEK